MSLAASIAKNTAIQVVGKVIGTLLGLLALGMMTRYLSTDGYGAFTTAMGYLQIVGTVVDFGLTLTMLTMLSRPGADEDRIASNILTLRLVSGIGFFAIAPLIGFLLPYGTEIHHAIALGSLSFFAIVVTQVLTSVLQRHLAGTLVAIGEVLGRLVLLGGMALVIARDGGLLGVIGVVALSNVFQLALSYRFAGKFVRFRPAWDMVVWRQVIRESLPIGISIAFNLIYLKGDVLLLSLYRSQTEVGLYGAAYKVLDVITIIPMIFMGMVTPVLAASWSAKSESGAASEEFTRRLGRAFDAMAIMAIPLGAGTWFVGERVMRLVAGPEFSGAGQTLAILMLGATAVFFGALFGHAVVAVGLQRPMIWAYALTAAVSLALYLTFIPVFGGIAAAWVTVLSEAAIAVVAGIAVLRRSRARLSLGVLGKCLLSSGFMVAFLATSDGWSLATQLPVAVAIYFVSLWGLGGVSLEMARALLKKSPVA
jgi:O-antigen/teichoic acid export membrane protein